MNIFLAFTHQKKKEKKRSILVGFGSTLKWYFNDVHFLVLWRRFFSLDQSLYVLGRIPYPISVNCIFNSFKLMFVSDSTNKNVLFYYIHKFILF